LFARVALALCHVARAALHSLCLPRARREISAREISDYRGGHSACKRILQANRSRSRATDFAAEMRYVRGGFRIESINYRLTGAKSITYRRKRGNSRGKQSRRAGRGVEWPTRLVQVAIRSHQTVKRRTHLRELTSRARVRTYVSPPLFWLPVAD